MFSKVALMILLLLFAAVSGAGVRYRLESIEKKRALIVVEVSPGSVPCDGKYFGAVTLDEGVHCNGFVTAPAGIRTPLVWEDKGRMGDVLVHWFSFNAALFPPSDSLVHGTIELLCTATFHPDVKSTSLLQQATGSLLHLSSQKTFQTRLAAKRLNVSAAPLPFTSGLRIDVPTDGIYELTAEFLSEHGVPIDRIATRAFRLFCAQREVPLLIPNSHHRRLASNDRLLFYGTALRGTNGRLLDYGSTNRYWLTWEGKTGARVALVPGGRREDPTLYGTERVFLAESYTDTLHCEKDEMLIWLGSVDGVPPTELNDAPGALPDSSMWYWGVCGLRDLTSFTFKCPSPEKRAVARIRAGLMGMSSIDSLTPDHEVTFFINNKPAGENNRHVWDGQRYTVFESDTFTTSLLANGDNRVTVQTHAPRSTDRCALDWIEVIYSRNYSALDDVASFSSSSSATAQLTEYSVDGFGAREIDLWDISRNRCFTGMVVEEDDGDNKGTYRLIFQDSSMYPVEYYAQIESRRITEPAVLLDTIGVGWDTLGECEYIAISVDSFKTDLLPLLAVHEQQGLKTAFVSIEDIYNRFTHGISNPEAVRLFLQYLQKAGRLPRYVLLGGDCTHNLYKKNADLTIIPTHLSRMPGWGPGADDGYFTLVNEEDIFPDCAIGRFPARNRRDMQALVDKTVRYLREPDMSYWRDHLLFLGGGAPEFSAFNTQARDDIIGNRFRISRLDADPASPWYSEGTAARRAIADNCNTGVYIVNFNGHGGGNIWSDNDFFSFNDLSLLHNGQWKGGRLPLVLSFTCLTGFFESTEYRSLGEEFVRCEKDGAIAFYGASAYTSQAGNLIMNRMFLEEILTGTHTTIGDLILYCETRLLVQYRAQYLPLVRQYNLLGDPALPLTLVPDTMRIVAEFDTASHTLSITARADPLEHGTMRIALMEGMDVLEQTVRALDADTFRTAFTMKTGAPPLIASVRGYAWNDTQAVRGTVLFTKDTLAVAQVQIAPAVPTDGDTITVSCRPVASVEGDSGVQVYCMYTVTSGEASRAQFSGLAMTRNDEGLWINNAPLIATSQGENNERLHLYFRLAGPQGTVQSSVYTYTLQQRPDFVLRERYLPVYWNEDSLAVSFTIQNIGAAPAPPASVLLRYRNDANQTGGDTIALLSTGDTLAEGKMRGFTVALPDTVGSVYLYVEVDPERIVKERVEGNNRLDGRSMIWHKVLRNKDDTLRIDSGRTVITPADTLSSPLDIFIVEDSCGSATPLATSSSWQVVRNGVPARWFLASRPSLKKTDSLVWSGNYPVRGDDSSLTYGAFMFFDTLIGGWRCAQPGSGSTKREIVKITVADEGWYAPARFSDETPPELLVSIHGKTLEDVDYTAKDRPFTVLLSDPSSVIPQSVRIFLNGKKLDAAACSAVPSGGDLRSISVSAYPEAEHRVDSLEVQCSDFAGNLAKRTFAYIPGTDLSVRSFTCHPNPFSARKRGDGTVEKIRFAYLITDIASSVTLSIFTVSGKKIWTWSGGDKIGYQQIEWNGRDRDGYRIANGTYYAKLLVKNDHRKAVKIIRIAKLEGF